MNKILLCVVGLLFSSPLAPTPSLACANDYVTNYKAVEKSRSVAAELTEVKLVVPWDLRRHRLEVELVRGGDYQLRNDLAVAMMHTGDAAAALPILQEIEKTNPNLYQTASNLGTAYELAGDPEHALEWIRKGIERNPLSHEGSEWIHVRILEAKIAHAKEALWMPAGSILGLDFGSDAFPRRPVEFPRGNTGEILTLEEVKSGLKHQLQERLQFSKEPDRIVTSLIFDFGNLVALDGEGISAALDLYGLAAHFVPDGQHSTDLSVMIQRRTNEAMRGTLTKKPFDVKSEWLGLAFVALSVGCGVFGIRRSWRKKRRRSEVK